MSQNNELFSKNQAIHRELWDALKAGKSVNAAIIDNLPLVTGIASKLPIGTKGVLKLSGGSFLFVSGCVYVPMTVPLLNYVACRIAEVE